MNIPKLMAMAREASLKSDHHSFKLGAVLCDKRGRPISVGTNWLTKTHPLIRRYNLHKTLHAELAAIFGVRHKTDLKDSKIFVYRELNSGKLGLAKPCETCVQIMRLYKIKEMWYTTENGVVREKL